MRRAWGRSTFLLEEAHVLCAVWLVKELGIGGVLH